MPVVNNDLMSLVGSIDIVNNFLHFRFGSTSVTAYKTYGVTDCRNHVDIMNLV